MKENEVINLGFNYTGMGARANTTDWTNTKERAQQIKRTYKGADFRIVDERCGTNYGSVLWKNIYGNEIFSKAQYFNQSQDEKYLNETHFKRLEKLKKEYEENVKKEMEYYENKKANYEFLMSLKKEKK